MLIGAHWPQIASTLDADPFTLDGDSTATTSSLQHLDHRTGRRNVYKFGGTSVGSPERLGGLVRIVRDERSRVLAVVVSAMGHTTDHLLEAVDFAVRGDQQRVIQTIDAIQALTIRNAHDTQRLLLSEGGSHDSSDSSTIEDMTELVAGFFKPLRELIFGISLLQEKTAAALDTVLSYGERISASIVTVRPVASILAAVGRR